MLTGDNLAMAVAPRRHRLTSHQEENGSGQEKDHNKNQGGANAAVAPQRIRQ